jgi:predicted RNase H-like nuclease (RuvC/YqgF family)
MFWNKPDLQKTINELKEIIKAKDRRIEQLVSSVEKVRAIKQKQDLAYQRAISKLSIKNKELQQRFDSMHQSLTNRINEIKENKPK